MTADIHLFTTQQALFTTFLNVKGKILFDAILAKPLIANQKDDDMELWMDVASEDMEAAMKHLRKYAIRKKVGIQDISHVIEVFSVQTQHGVDCKEGALYEEIMKDVERFESEEFPGEKETDVIVFGDPRTSLIGARVLCGKGSFEIEDPSIKYYDNGNHTEYNLIRYLNAVGEGSSECGGHFPLHLNFNQLNGVSTTKGCYIG